MGDIAKGLELSKPTLYLYFENKEALFFARACFLSFFAIFHL
jgi:AcrR family transcriptional regulator